MDKKRFFTKKKLFIFGGILLFLILFCYFLYKIYYLSFFVYYNEDNNALKTILNRDTVVINHSDYKDKYFDYDGIKFLKVLGDCSSSGSSGSYSLATKYSCEKGSIFIRKSNLFISPNRDEISDLYITSFIDTHRDIYSDFMNRHSISTDDDLFNYLASYNLKKPNIFSTYNSINDYYVINDIISKISTSFSKNSKFFSISGDYSGYGFEDGSIYVFYLKNDSGYDVIEFNTSKSNVSKDDIYKAISSVVID